MRYRHPGFLKSFGARLGVGLADELLDRWFPPAPSFLQRFADAFVEQAPLILHLIEQLQPKPIDGYAPVPAAAPSVDEILRAAKIHEEYAKRGGASTPTGVAWAPGHPLGEFTCPKCGGHTWSTSGPIVPPTVERYCTNGLETSYGPGLNPNTVKEPCMFRWKSTEDHMYFTPPPKVRGGSCTDPGGCKSDKAETQTCVPPQDRLDAMVDSLLNRDWPALESAIGSRKRDDEHLMGAAARVIREADAFIRQQSDKIAGLMLDNVFPPGKGEIGFLLTEDIAKKIGLRYAPGAAPIRVSMVLDGWQWAVRLGLGHVGGELIRVDWDTAVEILREAKSAPKTDQTEMAQNAAGGVA